MIKRYDTDVCDAVWVMIEPHLPPAKPGGRPRSTDARAVVNAIFYLLRTGCQWRLLPRCFPPWSTVHHYFRAWDRAGVWVRLHRAVYRLARAAAGRDACPTVVIMDGQSVKTTERGGSRGFDAIRSSRAASATSWSTRSGCSSPPASSPPGYRIGAGERLVTASSRSGRRSARSWPTRATRAAA